MSHVLYQNYVCRDLNPQECHVPCTFNASFPGFHCWAGGGGVRMAGVAASLGASCGRFY